MKRFGFLRSPQAGGLAGQLDHPERSCSNPNSITPSERNLILAFMSQPRLRDASNGRQLALDDGRQVFRRDDEQVRYAETRLEIA